MVRLKEIKEIQSIIKYEFQFQYGAIESGEKITGYDVADRFQFQYGAIESLLGSSFI